MIKFILKRILIAVLLLIVMSFMTFMLMRLTPGNYLDTLKLDPQSAAAHFNLGLLMAEQKKMKQAESELRLALKFTLRSHREGFCNGGGRNGSCGSYLCFSSQMRCWNSKLAYKTLYAWPCHEQD